MNPVSANGSRSNRTSPWSLLTLFILTQVQATAEVPLQPLRANLVRVAEALEFIGAPLPDQVVSQIQSAREQPDVATLQAAVDPIVGFFVDINPEVRVKVGKRPEPIELQAAGYTPVLVKITNHSTSTERLSITSTKAGPVYAGMTPLSAFRMQREARREIEVEAADAGRFLDLAIYRRPPMTERLSGLEVEYAIALIHANQPGTLEATIGFDVGQGNQDIGFRGEVPTLFKVRPGVPVTLRIKDDDGRPTTGKFVFRDRYGHVFPPQAKRLAPDFYFQEQIYRHDGDTVLLPPGDLEVTFSRGPEYRELKRMITIPEGEATEVAFTLERWIRPADFGFYSGDHHIHGAGCAHYTMPTLGVSPADMFLQVKGEGLNVGCVLTWGPCFEFQRQFFESTVHQLSEPLTLIKYDLEISGFGSAALGHVCLLNLRDQTYPNSDGTKDRGWPTWTTPVMRWARDQGGITGYAHSASGLQINPDKAATQLMAAYDKNRDGVLNKLEAEPALLPKPFSEIDRDQDSGVLRSELQSSLDQAADELPNLAIPEMNSVGAMEICVSVAAGVCDFISAMDTARIPEWNMFYHILNCGFPLKVSGETDFPCMSGSRVGQGRVYVQLGSVRRLDFGVWCEGLAAGRSYVSDGYAHALDFSVNDVRPGFGNVHLEQAGSVTITARVAFAPQTPAAVAHGLTQAPGGRRFQGDTVTFHGPPPSDQVEGGQRTIEVVVNGQAVAQRQVPADGNIHDLAFVIPITDSSWVALRQFPQLHTNPVDVLIDRRPIRASANSARWCQETIHQLWRSRERSIASHERAAAKATFDWAIKQYQAIERDARDRSE